MRRLHLWALMLVSIFLSCDESSTSPSEMELSSSSISAIPSNQPSSSSLAQPVLTSSSSDEAIPFSSSAIQITEFSSSSQSQPQSSSESTGSSSSYSLFLLHGSFVDQRDGQVYKSVKIQDQVWMAQNLNYSGDDGAGSRLYEKGLCPQEYGLISNPPDHAESSNCTKFGRLYTWSEVMAGNLASEATPNGAKGICPTAWHVPSLEEWNALLNHVKLSENGNGSGVLALRDSLGWYSGPAALRGNNRLGFNAEPAGSYIGIQYTGLGADGTWWTSQEAIPPFSTEVKAYKVTFGVYQDMIEVDLYAKGAAFSLRCVHD